MSNRADYIHYTIRLNLTKDSHQRIYEMLERAGQEQYGGISKKILELLEEAALKEDKPDEAFATIGDVKKMLEEWRLESKDDRGDTDGV